MTIRHRIALQLTPLKGLIIAVILCCIMTGATFWASFGQFSAYKAGQQHVEQISRQQGQEIGSKLCLTLRKLAALSPPAGSPGKNPARAYDQQLHAILAQMGPDIGCPAG
jgi:hypothetical protein